MIFLTEAEAARLEGKVPRQKRGRARRPDIPSAPRQKRGEGDRQRDLDTLAAAGWTCTHYDHATGTHWLSGPAGETPRATSYREMLDRAVAFVAEGKVEVVAS